MGPPDLANPSQRSPIMQSIEGQIAWITGAGSGIGRAAALALAKAGAVTVLSGRRKAQLEETAGLVAAAGGKATVEALDVTEAGAVQRVARRIEEGFGRLDILVNNAGIQHIAALQDFPPEKWDAILAINLSSAFHTTRVALPAMLASKCGRIINIASAHGLVASPYKSAYVAAKHGIVGLTKVIALETAEHGITCNAVCPGYVHTPLVEAQIDGQAKAHGIAREQVIRDVLLAQQPNKRFATVDELGALTVFLASDAAASITGIALPVDGGWTAH
jgi:3-hydroxybutyrate dehydrogenase